MVNQFVTRSRRRDSLPKIKTTERDIRAYNENNKTDGSEVREATRRKLERYKYRAELLRLMQDDWG